MIRYLFIVALAFVAACAQASVGVTEIPVPGGDGPITVFYPSSTPAKTLQRGPFTPTLAESGTPVRGNGRLIVVSHGSGGSPWTYTDLATKMVEAGFIVAIPLHQGDNWKDMSRVGPPTWKQRPAEASATIDALARDDRFAPLLSLDKVGAYGMSAGGHTALTLAGGRWSPAALVKHCEAHIDDDFASCVGLSLKLRGDMLDGVKKALAKAVIRWRMDDAQSYGHDDPRFAAVIAEVPYSVDFDLKTLAAPRVPLGIVQAGQDKWLPPRHHSGAVLQACRGCEVVADVPSAGHASFLSPPPPVERLPEIARDLLSDPPGFDRSLVPPVHQRAVAFFRKHLLP